MPATATVEQRKALYFSSQPPREDRRDAREAKDQGAAIAVAVMQPTRRGFIFDPTMASVEKSDCARLSTPLGRFCAKMWPNDAQFGRQCYQAGEDYAMEIRKARALRGLPGSLSGGSDVHTIEDMTPEGIAKLRALIMAADGCVKRANEALQAVFPGPRLPRAMERLCCTLDEPHTFDEGLLKQGLYRLSLHYATTDRGINSLKAY